MRVCPCRDGWDAICETCGAVVPCETADEARNVTHDCPPARVP